VHRLFFQPKGFTLMEMLVVLAIISVLSALAIPALVSLMQARNLTQNIDQLSGMLEVARNEAITRDTYVWVGIQSMTANGNSGLQVAAVASIDGTGNNTGSSNLIGVAKVVMLENVMLCAWSSLKATTRALSTSYFSVPIAPLSLANNVNGISFQSGSTEFNQKTSITFTPRGQALLPGAVSIATGYDPYIDVSLRETNRTQIPVNAEDTSIVIDGSTGAIQILRLQ
jgi:prepilin-type N-terminal cleavage/methylation domain-containing protein